MDTIAACGDVNRNVVASANPHQAELHPEVVQFARDILISTCYPRPMLSTRSGSATNWLQAMPSRTMSHCTDQLISLVSSRSRLRFHPKTMSMSLLTISATLLFSDNNQKITGYTVVIGGGMGMTHNNKKTYPRLASHLGYVTKDKAIAVGEKVMFGTARLHGDRVNRKHARLKYTVDDHGIDWYREQVEERLGFKLEPPRPYEFNRNGDRYGWVPGKKGHQNFTMFIQNGRVADFPGFPLKTGLRKLAKVHKGLFRLTCNGHMIVADVPDAEVSEMKKLLAELRLDNLQYT